MASEAGVTAYVKWARVDGPTLWHKWDLRAGRRTHCGKFFAVKPLYHQRKPSLWDGRCSRCFRVEGERVRRKIANTPFAQNSQQGEKP